MNSLNSAFTFKEKGVEQAEVEDVSGKLNWPTGT